MVAFPLDSAQDFIRALKAPSDPPHTDGPSKIELAREAWDNASFYFPNKAEVTVDWLLTRLLKDKAKAGGANPILDSRHWQLLSDILCSPEEENVKPTGTSRAAKSWLLPLLNRIPLAPILTAYFSLSVSLDERARLALNNHFTRCLTIIWPLVSPKFGADVLLECFGALLAHLATNWYGEDETEADSHMTQTALLIIPSYRSAYGISANKKKLYTTFLQNHFSRWLQCSQRGDSHSHHGVHLSLISEIYSAGIETLFNVDILRNMDDHRCDAALRDAIGKALPSSTKAVLHVLPLLFSSFAQSLKKNRTALFGQNSNNAAGHTSTQVQVDSLVFYAFCEHTIAAAPISEGSLIWDTRIALLETVDSESLFSTSDATGLKVLRGSGEMAVRVFTSSREDAVSVGKAVDVLTALTRIDYDLIAPNLPVIWPALAQTSPSLSSSTYLRLLVDFQTRTRMVNKLVESWLEAVCLRHLQASGAPPREAYSRVLGGPLFSFESLDRLGQSIHGFLTPGQVVEVALMAVEKFQGKFQQFRVQDRREAADGGDGSRKKRRKSTGDDAQVEPEWYAVEFALVSRIVVVVLSSLAIRTMLEDSRREVHDVVGSACGSVITRAVKATLRALDADNRRGTWAWQVVATGALHVYHDRKSRGWPNVQLGEDIVTQLRAILGHDDVLPEFSLMIVKTLLNDSAHDGTGAQSIIDDVLRYLELQSHNSTEELSWSGKTHELSDNSIVAIVHLVLSRWLPLFDSRATSEQLVKLAYVVLNLNKERLSITRGSTRPRQQLTPASVFAIFLHNAEMWELRRFRDAFFAQLHAATAPLASMDAQRLLDGARNSVPPKGQTEVASCVAAFEILLHTSEEYLSRTLRLDFLQRALVADVLIGTGAMDQRIDARSLLIIREFIRRAVNHSGGVDQLNVDGYFGYLLGLKSLPPVGVAVGKEQNILSVTLDLISGYLAAFLRRARGGEERLAIRAVEDIKKLLDVPAEQRPCSSDSIANGALLRLVSIVASNYEVSQLPQQLQDSLRSLYEHMIAVFSAELLRTSLLDGSSASLNPQDDGADALRMWSHALWLGRWIQTDMSTLPRFGSLLLGRMSANHQQTPSPAMCLSLLDVLREELYAASTDRRPTYVGCIVAGYLLCSRCCDPPGFERIDATLSSISRALSDQDYSHLVDYITEATASSASFDVTEVASLFHLLRVVGLSAPEGTSRLTQQAFSKNLILCADRPNYLSNPEIRSAVLGLLSGFCSDRPASLRPSDLSTVWSILGQLLAHSPEHDQTTNPTVFQDIVGIVSALVRLRRDLVLNTLPHLGMILRRLTSALRGPRPQLGAKQTRLVMNTLPAWLSAAQPLSAEEARALARLMTTLATKTIVRTHGPNAEAQKPESLARPFAKHAAYVLTAYIEAVNDPLCHISTQVRRELQPGLFALCDMLGEHSRDAMMVSALDASGKVMMKSLWKEYEKQRYVGRG